MSLRGRLLLITLSLVAGGLLVAGILTYEALSTSLIDRVDDQLRSAREPAAASLQVQGPQFGPAPGTFELLPSGTYVELRDAQGRAVDSRVFGLGIGDGAVEVAPPDLSDVLAGSIRAPAGATRSFTVSTSAGPYRALATSLGPFRGTFTVATPLAEIQRTLNRLITAEAFVGVAVLGLAAVLALWFVRLGLRPLEGIGETAGAIAAGDLSRRVEPADERTEVGRLGLSLNAMLAQIESAFEQQRASESRLRRFVADASHELRTPITSIRGYAELFRRGADTRPDDLERSMTRIEAEAARMGVLVDDLLLLARLDQGRALLREPVDLGSVLADAVESARAVDPERPIDVETAGPADVTGDEGRLRQVLDNLLDNARVHTPPGTPVHIRLRDEGDQIVLSVEDDGPGLGQEDVEKAFDRFYRGDPVRSRETGGAGLGLAIVAAIVEAHGGSIELTSPEGSGAHFEIRLPSREDAASAPGTDAPANGTP